MRTILAALDAGPLGSQVLRLAAEIAAAEGAALVLLRALEPMRELRPAAGRGEARERAERELRALAERAPAGVEASWEVAAGPAGEAICATARRLGAGLVVLGAHARGGGRLLGLTAIEVLSAADCSVLLVRDGAEG